MGFIIYIHHHFTYFLCFHLNNRFSRRQPKGLVESASLIHLPFPSFWETEKIVSISCLRDKHIWENALPFHCSQFA